MKIGKFALVNPEKVDRAINGAVSEHGEMVGGVGRDASDEQIIAAYDKLAGLILVGQRKVKTGSFWNFKDNKAFSKPDVVYIVRGVDGKVYEIADGNEAPLEVQAAEQVAQDDSSEEDEEKPKASKSKKSKKSVEDEE